MMLLDWLRQGDLGLFGITIPAEDGGAGMDATAAVIHSHHTAFVHDVSAASVQRALLIVVLSAHYHCASILRSFVFSPQ